MTTMAEGYGKPPFGPENPMPRGYAPPGYEMGPLDNIRPIISEGRPYRGPLDNLARPAPQFSGGQNNAATGSSTALSQQRPPTLPPQIGQQKFGDSGIGSLGGGGQTNVSLNLQGSATMNPQGANQNSGQGQRTMMFAEGGPAKQGIGGLNAGNNASTQVDVREADIIKAYFRSANISPSQGVKLVQSAIQSGVKFTRIGNTVLGYKLLSQDSMQVFFFSVEDPKVFTQSVGIALTKIKQAGARVIYMSRTDPSIIQAFQSLGLNAQQSDNPEYKVMVTL